jgi:hypothetical protein
MDPIFVPNGRVVSRTTYTFLHPWASVQKSELDDLGDLTVIARQLVELGANRSAPMDDDGPDTRVPFDTPSCD